MTTALCNVDVATQPTVYAGNHLLDCHDPLPHTETAIAVDPRDRNHIIGGYHSFIADPEQAPRIAATVAISRDRGSRWQVAIPPRANFTISGDPAVAIDRNGRTYLSSIADREDSFVAPSVLVTYSDDGGTRWSPASVVARGRAALVPSERNPFLYQDKSYIAVDTSAASPYRNRVYVTWTSFQITGETTFRSPILIAYSDDGVHFSPGHEISGFHAACSVQFGGGPNGECDENQFSMPAVAPDGRVYVAFENYNTPEIDQLMVVSSADGGRTWSAPVRIDSVFDTNLPIDEELGQQVLSGCRFRLSPPGNLAADPSDPRGQTLYATWTDNRHGDSTTSNMDVLLARSNDGGQHWSTWVIDQAPNDQFFPWVAVAPDGRVDVSYMDRSVSSGQDVCQYSDTLSRLRFERATGDLIHRTRQDVATARSDAGHVVYSLPDGQAGYIGDYSGAAIGPDGATWMFWTDARETVADPPAPQRNHSINAVAQRTERP